MGQPLVHGALPQAVTFAAIAPFQVPRGVTTNKVMRKQRKLIHLSHATYGQTVRGIVDQWESILSGRS